MLILKPQIFKKFPEISFGFTTKAGGEKNDLFYANMSYTVGDNTENVDQNRTQFFKQLGLTNSAVAYQMQVHEDKISVVESDGNCGESDALITTKNNLGLAISTADCPSIFIYDRKRKIICGVHSGWRGTSKRILEKTLIKLIDQLKSNPTDLYCYIAPSISQVNYEVSKEVAEQFNEKDFYNKEGRYFLDLAGVNYRMLINCGVKESQIQISQLCTFEFSSIFHSFRRWGNESGRAIAVIAMKGNE
ncbi:MAG: peptidoglycan editing factor PgeF [Ignavibacteria bacterium]|nr:peptidoglycan editing factor PgeF [Ignavibacteria bacterium]